MKTYNLFIILANNTEVRMDGFTNRSTAMTVAGTLFHQMDVKAVLCSRVRANRTCRFAGCPTTSRVELHLAKDEKGKCVKRYEYIAFKYF